TYASSVTVTAEMSAGCRWKNENTMSTGYVNGLTGFQAGSSLPSINRRPKYPAPYAPVCSSTCPPASASAMSVVEAGLDAGTTVAAGGGSVVGVGEVEAGAAGALACEAAPPVAAAGIGATEVLAPGAGPPRNARATKNAATASTRTPASSGT